MAYGLKYKAEFQNNKKQFYRLRIYQRDYSGSSVTIGDLAGCALEVQGNLSSVIAPIVKTQLRFSVVDAPDAPAVSGYKFGNWQEFYTPDATLYKVVLGHSTNSGSSYTDIWSGYITPDSWQEDLSYRGIITVTARDGIGHLKDFSFDMAGDSNGLVSIYDLIQAAKDKVELPMSLQTPLNNVITADGTTILDACVNVTAYENMDWYEALERTLDSAGMTMRYLGGNYIYVLALRDLAVETQNTQALEFYGGNLELDPAVKEIREEVDYKNEPELNIEVVSGLSFGSVTSTYRCKTEGNTMPGGGTFSIPEHDAPVDSVDGTGKTNVGRLSDSLDPSDYLPDSFLERAEGDSWKNYFFIPGNRVSGTTTNPSYIYFWTKTSAVQLRLRFSNPLSIRYTGTESGKMTDSGWTLASIKYKVAYQASDNTIRYWNGVTWSSSEQILEDQFDSQNDRVSEFVLEMTECEDIDEGNIKIYFYNIVYKMWSAGGHGCYARLGTMTAKVGATIALKSDTVTTVNNSAYNVKMTRSPLFGALSKTVGFVTPQNYKGGLFYYPSGTTKPQLYPYMVNWYTDEADNDVPLPVAIHQQILCYYFGAARALNGNCAPTNNALFYPNRTATYKGHKYLFQGGTLDLFSGIINGATFREFVEFDELWDSSVAPTWTDEGGRFDSNTGS